MYFLFKRPLFLLGTILLNLTRMIKAILVLRVCKDIEQKQIVTIQARLQEYVSNDYYSFVVPDQKTSAPVFEVYNAEQLTPIAIEELKAKLNLE
jgi:hypothetical protein